MTESVVRLFIGTLTLAGAAAGAVNAPRSSATAAKASGAISEPIFLGAAAGLLVVLALVLVRSYAAVPAYARKRRA